MSRLRTIRLTGGPDAANLRVVDLETGELLQGVVKIELLCLPVGGALVNVTQACRLAEIDVEALNVGVPLIDLPDDHPEVAAADELARVVEQTKAQIAAALKVPAEAMGANPAKTARELALEAAGVTKAAPKLSDLSEPTRAVLLDMAYLAGARDRAEAEACVAQPPKAVVLPPVKQRKRRTMAEMADELRQPPADPAPPPLPVVPGENVRRAPPPEEVKAEEEPDLSSDEKAELATLLEQAAPRSTLPPGGKWPFQSSAERRAAAGLPSGGDDV